MIFVHTIIVCFTWLNDPDAARQSYSPLNFLQTTIVEFFVQEYSQPDYPAIFYSFSGTL